MTDFISIMAPLHFFKTASLLSESLFCHNGTHSSDFHGIYFPLVPVISDEFWWNFTYKIMKKRQRDPNKRRTKKTTSALMKCLKNSCKIHQKQKFSKPYSLVFGDKT